jgi:hypothetical protein
MLLVFATKTFYALTSERLTMDWGKLTAPSEEYLRLSERLCDAFNRHRQATSEADSERIADEMMELNRLLDQTPERQYLDEIRGYR